MWGLKYYYMEIAFPTNTIEYERIWHSFDTAPVSMCGGNMWLFWIQIKPKNYWEFPAHDRKVVERQHHEIMQDVLKTGELENLVGGLEHVSLSPIVGMMIQSDFHIFQGGRYTTNQKWESHSHAGFTSQVIRSSQIVTFRFSGSSMFLVISIIFPCIDSVGPQT